MKHTLFFLLSSLLLVACDPDKNNKGKLVQNIEFQIKLSPETIQLLGDSTSSLVYIDNYEKQIDNLIDANEIALSYTDVELIIDYPLSNPALFLLKSDKGGFTYKELLRLVCEKYKQIYNEEEESATVKTIPADGRKGLANRNRTNGKYGIWGHDLSDLVLSGIEVYKSKGVITLVPLVES